MGDLLVFPQRAGGSEDKDLSGWRVAVLATCTSNTEMFACMAASPAVYDLTWVAQHWQLIPKDSRLFESLRMAHWMIAQTRRKRF